MKCYICNKICKNSLKVEGIEFGYCEEHKHKVQVGAIRFSLTGKNEYLLQQKEAYDIERKGAALIEFEKQKGMFELDDINEERYD
jgi:hypothetical protein